MSVTWTARDAAAHWGCRVATAQRRLARLHRLFGDRFVWRADTRGRPYRTTEAKLAQARTAVVEKNTPVTQEQFSKAIAELWRELQRLKDAV